MSKKSFTGVGIKSNEGDEKPEYKKSILDDIRPSSLIPLNPQDGQPKRQTFLLREEVIERIKDFVYTQKKSGELLYTQQNLIEEALEAFLKGKEVVSTPKSYIEKRGRKQY